MKVQILEARRQAHHEGFQKVRDIDIETIERKLSINSIERLSSTDGKMQYISTV